MSKIKKTHIFTFFWGLLSFVLPPWSWLPSLCGLYAMQKKAASKLDRDTVLLAGLIGVIVSVFCKYMVFSAW